MTMGITVGFAASGEVLHGAYRKLTHADLSNEAGEWLAKQILAREQKIGEIMSGMPEAIRVVAAIKHDAEFAPMMTQGEVLRRLGLLPEGDVDISSETDDEVSYRLRKIIEGLAFINSFLEGTDKATERELLDWLQSKVLREEVRFVPPSPDMSERIDLSGCFKGRKKAERDKNLPRFVTTMIEENK
jgi:hypothetical protein